MVCVICYYFVLVEFLFFYYCYVEDLVFDCCYQYYFQCNRCYKSDEINDGEGNKRGEGWFEIGGQVVVFLESVEMLLYELIECL